MKRKPPSRTLGGVRFVSGGDGHWYSECGRYAAFHMMRWSSIHACWELFTIDDDQRPDDMISTGTSLTEIIWQANKAAIDQSRSWFSERPKGWTLVEGDSSPIPTKGKKENTDADQT